MMATRRAKGSLKSVSARSKADAVTIPTSRFLQLLAAESRLAANSKRTGRYPRSPIDLNADMVAFIVARLGRMRLSTIIAESREVFGERALTFMRERGPLATPPRNGVF